MQHLGRPRVAIVGAGTLGCFIGAHLAHQAQLTLIGARDLISAVSKQGLIAVDADKTTHRVEPNQLTLDVEHSRIAGADIVIVACTSTKTAETARLMAPYLTSDSVVVSCQTGLDNVEVIDESISGVFTTRADRPLIVASTVGYNVTRVTTTTVQQTAGSLHISDHPRAAILAELTERGNMRVATHSDMNPVLWSKLMLSLNNAVNALSGVPIAQELRDRNYREVLAAAMDEALLVAAASGTTPARITGFPMSFLPKALRMPTALFQASVGRNLQISPAARSSMFFDLDAGTPTEVDNIQGAVARLGRRHGIDTPVCARITDLINEATPGRTLSGRALKAAVGA